MNPVIPVACGVLVDAAGEVLVAQRPAGKIAAGWWEFPGGKIEPGETPLAALTRELHEEIGVVVTAARPLLRFTHHYGNRSIALDAWRIDAWQGEPHGREGQALRWQSVATMAAAIAAGAARLPTATDAPRPPASAPTGAGRPDEVPSDAVTPLLPTVAPVVAALRLPAQYAFTPERAGLAELLAGLEHLASGTLLRLRQPNLSADDYAERAAALLPAVRGRGLPLVLDGDPALAVRLGADGWHARAHELDRLAARPGGLRYCFASAHTVAELARAAQLGCDAAVLGPVRTTATHPGAPALGWAAFGALAEGVPLPVYAIGGLGPGDEAEAFGAYAQGVAGIRGWWPSRS